jgi:glycosyltransferase involved in cell wall biosynthesis
MNPKVSVLMTVYNAQDTVQGTLRSILNNGYSDYECVICDDGSTDNTVDRISKWLDGSSLQSERYKFTFDIFPNAKHIAKARNRALGLARGEYIISIDADDEMLPGCIAAQVKVLDENPDIGFTHTPCILCDANMKTVGYLLSMPADCAKEVKSWTHNGNFELEQKLPVAVPEDLFCANLAYSFINNWGCLIRRELMKKVGGWSEDLPGLGSGEDYDLNLKLTHDSLCRWIPQLSIKFRRDVAHSHERWDKDLGAFSNYAFIRSKFNYSEPLPVSSEVSTKRALDIGCGDKYVKLAGYEVVRLDSRESTGADIVCSADDLSSVKDAFDKIYSSHVLEHFPRAKVSNVIREWLRVLKVGGEVEIHVPDFMGFFKKVVAGESNEHDLHCCIFGAHTNDYDSHQCYFTEESLRRLFESQGVRVTALGVTGHNGGSLTLLGVKQNWDTDEQICQMLLTHEVSPSIIGPEDKKIVSVTTWSATAAMGKELVFEFSDAENFHHFYWMCIIGSCDYAATLHLTKDILSVKGSWGVTLWLSGVKVSEVGFEIKSEAVSEVDRLLSDYRK